MVVVVASFALLFLSKEVDTPTQVVPRSALDAKKIVIIEAAFRHGINPQRFLQTAKCESSLRPGVIGDDGNSIGTFQIHLPSHPEVTEEQAKDLEWATEWSAKMFKKDPTIWVCYNKLYGNN